MVKHHYPRLFRDDPSRLAKAKRAGERIHELTQFLVHVAKAHEAGLLPAHHVAIVRRDRIFDTLDDLFAAVCGVPPVNLTLVTGPSRTADIELTLAIGVHGPEKLDIILV